MADFLSPEARSALMSKVRGKDTKPEMIVRRTLHAMGVRYRLHAKELPGKPDIVMRPRKALIFVHGCYWHAHDDPSCRRSHSPRSNLGYWNEKLMRNKQRDAKNLQSLHEMGWSVLVIWECEIRDPEALQARLRAFLSRVAETHLHVANTPHDVFLSTETTLL